MHKKKGDTLIEVGLAIAILGMVVIAAISTMVTTLGTSEYTLQETMARAEIDVQAEALRYIHNAYTAQKDLPDGTQQDAAGVKTYKYREYEPVWRKIVSLAVSPAEVAELNSVDVCDPFYAGADDGGASNGRSIFYNKAFVINTRRLNTKFSANEAETDSIVISSADDALYKTNPAAAPFQPSIVYPRILFNSVPEDTSFEEGAADVADRSDEALVLNRAEGIWVTAACSNEECDNPEYYDFYIRTCWESTTDHPTSTLSSIIRLRNPDYAIVRK